MQLFFFRKTTYAAYLSKASTAWVGNLGDKFDEAPENGRCSGEDPNIWFPVFSRSPSKRERTAVNKRIAIAKSFCSTCEHSVQCLEYSLRHEPLGIWGGMTELERAKLRSARGINLSREGRIFFPGVGMRNANGTSASYRAKIDIDG